VLTWIDLGAGIGAAFTGRAGGASAEPYASLNLGGAVGDDPAAVRENRRRAGAELGLDPSRMVWMRQVHGAEVAYVDAPFSPAPLSPASFPAAPFPTAPLPASPSADSGSVDAVSADACSADVPSPATSSADAPLAPKPAETAVPGEIAVPGVDAILTMEPGLALAVLVADCAPVLLADPVARVVGAAHSGRPGTAAGVVPALVERMRERGADPGRMVAVIGPAVCGACYEVPQALRAEVAAAVPDAYATTRDGTPGLDIRRGITAQLSATGVVDVRLDPRCTMETPELFSFRRDGRTGRLAGFIWLRS
jgi:YfiH family protein